MQASAVPSDVVDALQAAPIEAARRWLIPFCKRMDSQFLDPPHIRKLGELGEDIVRGDTRRAIVSLAPGSGKSTFLQHFCAWCIGLNPTWRIIVVSAGAELSERNSRKTRADLVSEDWPFLTRLSQDTTAMHRWNTTEGGGLFAIGVGGNVTGWRANLIITDDLQNSAGSQTESDSLWEWSRNVLMPRLEPNGAVLVVQTRWAENDYVGRLLESPTCSQWVHLRLPALAEENDPLGRQVGEALWPERFSAKQLDEVKREVGSRIFETQYQARPVPLGGNIIKAEWLKRYDKAPAEFEKVTMSVDAAAKTGVSNDFSAIAVVGSTRSEHYILDIQRRKVEYPDLIRMVTAAFNHWKPSAIYVEDTSNATAMIQQLRNDGHLPIVPVKPIGSKTSRVEAITGILESGKVLFPNEAPWLLDFEREALSFPYGKNDDQIDALAMLLNKIARHGGGVPWTFVSRGPALRDRSRPPSSNKYGW